MVLDFVAEQGAENEGFAMTRAGGSYFVIGYGGTLTVPTLDIISTERNIIGNIVGTYNELAELMVLAQAGKVTLHTKTYPLDAAPAGAGRSRRRPGPRPRDPRPVAASTHPREKEDRWPRNCDSARKRGSLLLAGVDQLAEAVKSTLGPKGRNVILEKITGSPVVTNDGVTIAREIHLSDQFENMGAQLVKEAAIKTNDIVGDGTTTATVIAQAIIREGMQAIGQGGNPVLVKRGIDLAVGRAGRAPAQGRPPGRHRGGLRPGRGDLGQRRRRRSARCSPRRCTPSATAASSPSRSRPTHGMSVDFVEGFEYDNGYLSPYLVTNPASLEAILDDPYILLCSEKITKVQQLMPLLDKVMRAPAAAGHHRRERRGHRAEHAGAQPRQRHLPVRGDAGRPGSATGGCASSRTSPRSPAAQVYSKHSGFTLETMTVDQLGRARQVRVTADRTAIIGGAGSADAGRVPARPAAGRAGAGHVRHRRGRAHRADRRRCPARSP